MARQSKGGSESGHFFSARTFRGIGGLNNSLSRSSSPKTSSPSLIPGAWHRSAARRIDFKRYVAKEVRKPGNKAYRYWRGYQSPQKRAEAITHDVFPEGGTIGRYRKLKIGPLIEKPKKEHRARQRDLQRELSKERRNLFPNPKKTKKLEMEIDLIDKFFGEEANGQEGQQK